MDAPQPLSPGADLAAVIAKVNELAAWTKENALIDGNGVNITPSDNGKRLDIDIQGTATCNEDGTITITFATAGTTV